MSRFGMREGAVAIALMLAIGSYLYQHSEKKQMIRVEKESKEALRLLHETEKLKKLWTRKDISLKLQQIRTFLPKETLKRFDLQNHKVHIVAKNIGGRLLNRFLGKMGALPLQIQTLDITREGEKYRLECRCKW